MTHADEALRRFFARLHLPAPRWLAWDAYRWSEEEMDWLRTNATDEAAKHQAAELRRKP